MHDPLTVHVPADRFVVVTHALEERRTPGNTLIVQPDKPWQVGRLPAGSHHDAESPATAL